MSEQDNNGEQGAPNTPTSAAGGEDRYKNLQAELDRKLGNVTQQIDEKFQQILAQITPKTPEPAATKRPSVY